MPDAAVTAGAPHMLHGDSRHTDRAHGHVPRQPTVGWTSSLDGPVEGQVVASPDGATLYAATLGGTLWALDRGGHTRFKVPLGGRAYAAPAVAPDGTVYIGCDGGAFYAVDPTGKVRWRLETRDDADTSANRAADGALFFAAGTRVFGVRDGAVFLRFQAKGKVFTAPALTRDAAGETRVVVGSQDHRVYCLTPRGELSWSVNLGHDVDGTPAIGDDGAIYVGTDGDDVVRLSEDGRVVWRTAVGGPVRGALSITRAGEVLAGVYGPSPRLARVSPDGTITGSFAVRGTGTRETGVLGGALEDDDGALAFGAQDGFVRVFEPTGEARWTYDAHAEVDAPLTLLEDGALIVADYEGRVTLLR